MGGSLNSGPLQGCRTSLGTQRGYPDSESYPYKEVIILVGKHVVVGDDA